MRFFFKAGHGAGGGGEAGVRAVHREHQAEGAERDPVGAEGAVFGCEEQPVV